MLWSALFLLLELLKSFKFALDGVGVLPVLLLGVVCPNVTIKNLPATGRG